MGFTEGDIIGRSVEIYDGNIVGNIVSKTSVIILGASEIKDLQININGNLNGKVLRL